MAVRNRFLAFFYRLFLLAIGGYALYLLYKYHTQDVNDWTRPFYYFDFQTLLVAFVVIFAEVIANAIGLPKKTNGVVPGVWSPILLASLSYVLFDIVVYATDVWAKGGHFFLGTSINFMLFSKIIFPALFLGDYLLFGEKGTVKWRHPIFWELYPLFYFAFSLLVNLVWGHGFWAVDFFNSGIFIASKSVFAGNGGWNGVVICSFLAWMGYFLIAYLTVFFNGPICPARVPPERPETGQSI